MTKIQYINTHGTSTPAGDIAELKAIREVFGDEVPDISSTKALTGHALGAAGVNEAIYCLLMLEHGFLAAVGQYPGTGSASRRLSDPARAQRPRLAAHGHEHQLWLRWHQRHPRAAEVRLTAQRRTPSSVRCSAGTIRGHFARPTVNGNGTGPSYLPGASANGFSPPICLRNSSEQPRIQNSLLAVLGDAQR